MGLAAWLAAYDECSCACLRALLPAAVGSVTVAPATPRRRQVQPRRSVCA